LPVLIFTLATQPEDWETIRAIEENPNTCYLYNPPRDISKLKEILRDPEFKGRKELENIRDL